MTECPRCHAPLPQPPERFCPTCGADLTTAAPPPMAGGPPPVPYGGGYGAGGYGGPGGPGGPRPGGGSTPWERRNEIGFVAALVETTKQVLTQPTDFYRGMPLSGGIQSPLLYGLIIGYVGLVASTIYQTIFRTVIGSSLSRMGGGGEFDKVLPMLQGGFGIVFNLIFGPVAIVIGLFIMAGIVHLALLLLQAGERGFEPTFRVAAYAEGAAIINVVPFCGGLIAGVYTIVLLIIGISEAHGITRGKAAAAVLLPIVLFCCCCGIIPLLAIFGGLAGALGHAR